MLEKRVFTTQLFTKQAFTSGAGLIKTVVVDVSQIAPDWIFSIQHKFTGTGTIKIEVFVGSTRDGDYFAACTNPEAAAPTATVKVATIVPILGPFLKFVVTASVETVADLDMWLNSL
jgi:hypothetical protein